MTDVVILLIPLAIVLLLIITGSIVPGPTVPSPQRYTRSLEYQRTARCSHCGAPDQKAICRYCRRVVG